MVKKLKRECGEKWVCIGDFNDVLEAGDKKRGLVRPCSQLNLGRQAVADCELIDLRYEWYKFTWTNERQSEANIQ